MRRSGPVFRALFFLSSILLPLPWCFIGGTPLGPEPARAENRLPSLPETDPFGRIESIHLYRVLDGRNQNLVLSGPDLEAGDPLRVEGHISGIVVFCGSALTVEVGRRRFDRIRINRDGSLSARYHGTLDPSEIPGAGAQSGYFESVDPGEGPNGGDKRPRGPGYSLFPKIRGDAIHRGHRFDIRFAASTGERTLEIRQEGYRRVVLPDADEDGPRFNYVGSRMGGLTERVEDLGRRLRAISRGIAQVEEALEGGLVSDVDIVDREEIENALTLEESDHIWIYIDTLRGEPIPELETIAAHETLHKFVDRHAVTRNTEIRRLFADLRGFSPFSWERFLLVTQGTLPEESPEPPPQTALFFSFINEKHYLEDRKGGHAHENLDEFCASFLHTTLYPHRFRGNLRRPLRTAEGPEGGRRLTDQERQKIKELYGRSLRIFTEALCGEGSGKGSSALLSAWRETLRMRGEGHPAEQGI